MSSPRKPSSLACALVALGAAVAGCGGGGGSPSSPGTSAPTQIAVTPTANPSGSGAATTPTPTSGPPSGPMTTFTPRTSATGMTPSQFNVQSNPSGLAVTFNGAPAGTTPFSATPAFATGVQTIAIAPGNGAEAFTYVTDQTANGNHTVYYNQQFDLNGSIASIATSSLARRLSTTQLSTAKTSAAGEPHFLPPRNAHAPAFSTTRLAIRYRTSVLHAEGRSTFDLERGAGIARAVDVGFESGGERTRIADVPPGTTLANLRARVRALPEVVWAAPLQLRYKESATAVTPNDTHFDDYQQWDMFQIQSIVKPAQYGTFAWGYTPGNPNLTIAVIDTGLDSHHQDLAGKVVYGEEVIGGTITTGVAAAQDTDGHGTNVSGIAAADTNNGFGFAGVGFNTSLQIYKVFPDGPNSAADTGDIAQAVYDAVAHGAKVINMSLGSPQDAGFDPVERDAVEYAIQSGVSVVAASGNERADGSTTIDYPAAYDGVISVGASALNDSIAPENAQQSMEYVPGYSNEGPELTLVAPGGDPSSTSDTDLLHWNYNIYTTTPYDPANACHNIDDCKALFSGTSQATAHVSGAVALLLAANPSLTPAQITQILESTTDDLGDPFQGHGRLNVYRALAAVKGDTTGLPAPVPVNFRAFAYTVTPGSNRPTILDLTFPTGVAVSSSGTFRIADVPAGAQNFEIGVWDDVNGDGVIDAGDYFGSSSICATASLPCTGATAITIHPVAAGYVLQ